MDYIIYGIIFVACVYVAYKYGYDKGKDNAKNNVKVQYIDRIVPVKVELPNGVEIWVEGGK